MTSVTYSITGSDTGANGLNTPAYFCLDNFNGEREVKVADVQSSGREIDLSTFFEFDDAVATVSYSLADELPAELKECITLTTDGKLTVINNPVEKFAVTVKAVQKGKIQFLSVPYDMPTAISGADGFNGHSASARYNVAGQQLGESQKGINILRYKNGTARKVLQK